MGKHRRAIRQKTPDQRIYCDIATESDNPDLATLASSDAGLLNQGLLWNKLLLRIHLGVLLALSSCSSSISTTKVTAFYITDIHLLCTRGRATSSVKYIWSDVIYYLCYIFLQELLSIPKNVRLYPPQPSRPATPLRPVLYKLQWVQAEIFHAFIQNIATCTTNPGDSFFGVFKLNKDFKDNFAEFD